MDGTLKLKAHYNQLKTNVEIKGTCKRGGPYFAYNELKKDDNFSGLPYEILSSILTQLNTQELTAALCVCRSWRRRVLACREAFSTLRLFESKAESSNSYSSIRRRRKDTTFYGKAPLSDWCTSEMALERSRHLITVQTIRDYVQELCLCMAHRQHYQNLVYQTSKYNFPNLRTLHITVLRVKSH
ncbi:hypothetical protein BJV82DRAFT_321057 [Fennellomyces sp. T-0311]|nr:hypothetical protein BJV82DRAFT_321057 [Fennellomyces sp. T-0311]